MTDPKPEPAAEPSAAAAAAIARSRAKRAAKAEPASTSRAATARGGKFLAAGAAVGLSLAAVGAMSAATQGDAATQPPTPVQRVVISQPAQTPQQIVIVMPGADAAPSSTVIDVPSVSINPENVQVTRPAKPTPPPAPAVEKAPVTESGGS